KLAHGECGKRDAGEAKANAADSDGPDRQADGDGEGEDGQAGGDGVGRKISEERGKRHGGVSEREEGAKTSTADKAVAHRRTEAPSGEDRREEISGDVCQPIAAAVVEIGQ